MRPDDFDYEADGFDGFMSRSIDSLSQVNLDSQGPVSTAIRFDSSQTTGALGDAYRMRNILFDGKQGRTSYYNNQDPFMLHGELFDGARGIRFQNASGLGLAQFGVFGNNRLALKVAKDGFEVASATDAQLQFNSENNLFKIIDSKVGSAASVTTTADGTNTYSGSATTFYSHGLDFTPLIMAFVEVSPSQYSLMPYSETVSISDPGGGIISSIFRITADRNNVEIFHYVTTYAPGIGAGTYAGANVKYYLLQETAEQDS